MEATTQIDDRVIDTETALSSSVVRVRPIVPSAKNDANPFKDDQVLLSKILSLRRQPIRPELEERILHYATLTDAAHMQSELMRAYLAERESNLGYKAYEFVKRVLDVVLSSMLLLVLLPAVIVLSLMIYMQDRGPVLYYQRRTGKDGKAFNFYKFRSMVVNADALKEQLHAHNEATGPIFKMKDDPRVTRIGRWMRRTSVDELPQIINVLKGEMSIIGPRPLYDKEAAHVGERHGNRHRVVPGLLCLREICGRSALSFDEWMELDLVYVNCRSLKTDFALIFHAIPAVLRSENAY